MISLLVGLLVFGLIYWVITQIPMPQPMRLVVIVIMAIIGIVFLLQVVGGIGLGSPHLNLR